MQLPVLITGFIFAAQERGQRGEIDRESDGLILSKRAGARTLTLPAAFNQILRVF
jgi:hypothetical protein